MESSLELYVGQSRHTVNSAPIGLLLLLANNSLIFKTEYITTDDICECYIVDSGERFRGKMESECVSVIIN